MKKIPLLKENQIISLLHLQDSSILFEGTGNILYCEKEITLKKVRFILSEITLLFFLMKINILLPYKLEQEMILFSI